MRQSPHEHIVRFYFAIEDPPQLIMEFVPMGNLQDQHSRKKNTEDEAISTLQQRLSALTFLHERSPPIVHRDLKPENILVQCQDPFYIKLSDFGMSKASEDLRTMCGTLTYLPPELAVHHRHSSATSTFRYILAVDIWSFGTVTFEYVSGLPERRSGSALVWCRRIVKRLHDWDTDELIDLLSKMVVMDPRRRLSAKSCLARALSFDKVAALEELSSSGISYITSTFEPLINHRGKRIDRQDTNTHASPTKLLAGTAEGNSMLTTFDSDLKDGNKRHSSPTICAQGHIKKRLTAIWRATDRHNTGGHPQTITDVRTPSCLSIARNTMFECLLGIVEVIRIKIDDEENIGADAVTPLTDLCHRLEQLQIGEIRTYTDYDNHTTIVGVSGTKEITLATLTSSDVASSSVDLVGL
ncbi:hypothetical protein LTR32_003758 [Rachicladosporium monterosium]|uniref:Protein kinase domain-containing protein n=1 Tax=Rachicladosporium monterosium TaxID=1507873 RepID=A0ABR0L6I0_9PEZI|nr:hypothetical protein LTR32_003758 [Rachicladosporium monterosium]